MGLGKIKVKVLYADDDSDDCMIFKEALDDLGIPCELMLARNGFEALKAAREISPGLIFLDINMPLMGGMECLKEIRADNKFSETPVVIFSTSKNEKDINDTHDAGADLYAIKPDTFDEVVKLMALIFTMYKKGRIRRTTRLGYVVSDLQKA